MIDILLKDNNYSTHNLRRIMPAISALLLKGAAITMAKQSRPSCYEGNTDLEELIRERGNKRRV